LLGLLFAKYYKNYLTCGRKATIIVGDFKLSNKEPLFVFVSKRDSVEDSSELEKVGLAKNIKIENLLVKGLKQTHADLLGYPSVSEVKEALKKWHGLEKENESLSFVSFDFEPV
jgi:hypothetical protein